MTQPDADLLERFGEGDLGAFEALVERYERALLRYFFALSHDRQLAEDCAQEVFVRLFRARESYQPTAAFQTFLFRIARNYWIDVYRSRKVRPDEVSLDAPVAGAEEEGGRAAALPSAVASPDDLASGSEQAARLRDALARLPEIHRSVLALAAVQGLKYEHVAAILGIPIGTVKSRVHAAVAQLRRMLGEEAEPRHGMH